MRVLQRYLAVPLAVGDQERNPDLLHLAVEGDVRAEGHEALHVIGAPHPADVLPVVRHRALALVAPSRLLHLAPVVVGAPDETAGEAGLVGDCAGRVVAAQRDAPHPEPAGVDLGLLLQPVDHHARPPLGVVDGVQSVQPQRFARARLVDRQGRDPAAGQGLGQTRPGQHLLGGIQPVHIEHGGGGAAGALCQGEIAGDDAALVRDLDPAEVAPAHLDGALEAFDRLGVGGLPARRPVALHPLGDLEIERGPVELVGRRDPAPQGQVFIGQAHQLVAHLHPAAHELRRAGVFSPCGGLQQGAGHVLDLADPRAALQGDGDRQVPDVIAWKILEKRHCPKPPAAGTGRRRAPAGAWSAARPRRCPTGP